MIITNNYGKKSELATIFSDLSLSFNKELIKKTDSIIKQYEDEKNHEYHSIDLIYSPVTKTVRHYFQDTDDKKVPPYHKVDGQWVKGTGNLEQWFPYGNQNINHAKGKIVLLHEGEKATDYANNIGLVSFCFCGAKSQDIEFLRNQLFWLKSNGVKGAFYIADNDKAGEEKAQKLIKSASAIDFPLIIVRIDNILYPCKKKDDFADFVIAQKSRLHFLKGIEQVKQIKELLEQLLTNSLDSLIDDTLEFISNIKITAEEAKLEVEKLYQNDIDEADLIIAIDGIYNRLASPMSKSQWQKLCKSIRQKYRYDRIKLEAQRYLQEPDVLKQIDIKNHVCSYYGYSGQDFYKLVNYIEDLERTPQKQFWSVDELIEARNERQNWLIPSFLPQGELLMLAAKSKVGKSLLATEIAVKVLSGGEFLGEKVQRGKVLYTFSDESKVDFGDRIFNLGVDLLPNRGDLIGCSYLDLMDLKKFEEQLDIHRPKLVVIDSLTSTGNKIPFTENEAGFAIYLYRLKDLLQKYNCSCILIHHNNKGNEISGSERLKAACWGTAQMTTEQGTIVNEDEEADNEWSEDYRYLIMNHTRSTEPAKYKLLLNPSQTWIDQGIYEFCGEASDPTGEKREAADKILRFLKNNGQPNEVVEIEHYLGIPKKTIYKALDRLCRRGDVEKRRSSQNNRIWVFQYINKNSQQGKYSVLENTNNQNEGIDHPPPLAIARENEKKEPETIIEQESQPILTQFSREKRENCVRISETQDTVKDTDEKNQFSPNSHEGGGDQNEDILESSNSSSVKIPYCKKFSFTGMRVKHFSKEIEGTITSEPEKLVSGLNYQVWVRWDVPVALLTGGEVTEQNCWITTLVSDQINFKSWLEDQING